MRAAVHVVPHLPETTEVDLCPICGASGMAPCEEDDGQFCLDHWGRPATLPLTAEDAAVLA